MRRVLLHKYQCHTLLVWYIGMVYVWYICFNGNESHVLIGDAQGVNAQLLLMFVTRRHAKHMLNYEYLTTARIMHSVLA